MSAHVVLSCDGHRHGQPCRGALHTREVEEHPAARAAAAAGWRRLPAGDDGVSGDLCPSGGHDEEPPDVWHDGPQAAPVVADPLSGLLAPWPPRHADDRPQP